MKTEAKQFSQEAALKIYSQLDKNGKKLLEDGKNNQELYNEIFTR